MDRPAEEGGAQLQDGEQVGELRQGDPRVRGQEEDREAQGSEGQGAHAVAAGQRDYRRRPARGQTPLREPCGGHRDFPC